jgi:hypothetical protein
MWRLGFGPRASTPTQIRQFRPWPSGKDFQQNTLAPPGIIPCYLQQEQARHLQFEVIVQRELKVVENRLKRSRLTNYITAKLCFIIFAIKEKYCFTGLTTIEPDLLIKFTNPANDGPRETMNHELRTNRSHEL